MLITPRMLVTRRMLTSHARHVRMSHARHVLPHPFGWWNVLRRDLPLVKFLKINGGKERRRFHIRRPPGPRA